MADQGDWRVGLCTVTEQQLYMLENGLYSDCIFLVGPLDGETKEFRLHKNLMCRASAVLEAMLLPSSGVPWMLEAETGVVMITDIRPDIFEIVVRHVYGDESALSLLGEYDSVERVCLVADKYQMPALQVACETALCREEGSLLAPDLVWRALRLVDMLQGFHKLKEMCAQILRSQTESCLQSADFLESSESSVALLLKQESLSLTEEYPLVCAVAHWAKYELQRREGEDFSEPTAKRARLTTRVVLEPTLLPLMRLAACTPDQIRALTSVAEWLTEEEVTALRSGDKESLPSPLSRLGPRTILFNNCVIERPMVTKQPSTRIFGNERAGSHACCIEVSRNVRLLDFTLPSQTQTEGGARESRYWEDLKFTLYTCTGESSITNVIRNFYDKTEILYKQPTLYDSKIKVKLDRPLQMKCGNFYVIDVQFRVAGFYPLHSRAKEVVKGDDFFRFGNDRVTMDKSGAAAKHGFLEAFTYKG